MVLLLKYLVHCHAIASASAISIAMWMLHTFFSNSTLKLIYFLLLRVFFLKTKANIPGIMCIMWASLVHFVCSFFLSPSLSPHAVAVVVVFLLSIWGESKTISIYCRYLWKKEWKKRSLFLWAVERTRTFALVHWPYAVLCITLAIILYMV